MEDKSRAAIDKAVAGQVRTSELLLRHRSTRNLTVP
jgi:hypothetical protein